MVRSMTRSGIRPLPRRVLSHYIFSTHFFKSRTKSILGLWSSSPSWLQSLFYFQFNHFLLPTTWSSFPLFLSYPPLDFLPPTLFLSSLFHPFPLSKEKNYHSITTHPFSMKCGGEWNTGKEFVTNLRFETREKEVEMLRTSHPLQKSFFIEKDHSSSINLPTILYPHPSSFSLSLFENVLSDQILPSLQSHSAHSPYIPVPPLPYIKHCLRVIFLWFLSNSPICVGLSLSQPYRQESGLFFLQKVVK